MRSWKLATGGLLLSGLALVVLGNGFTGAAPPGGKDKASTRKAKQAPAGDAAAGRAEPGSKRPGVQTRPAATDPSDAAKAALLLRKQGKIISQSGDLKLKV
ncbi:MAG: hypothetical protein ACE5ID_05120, partial [Acidobacteriota bacterium]